MNFKMDADSFKVISEFLLKHCAGSEVKFSSNDREIRITVNTITGDTITINYFVGSEMTPTITKTVRIGDYK